MTKLSIGMRLTLWYLAIFAGAQLIFGAGMWFVLRHHVYDLVDDRLESTMKRTYREVSQFARSRKCDMRVAAYAIALSRLEVVYKQREIFP